MSLSSRAGRDGFPVDTPAFSNENFEKKENEIRRRRRRRNVCVLQQSVHSQDLSPADDANAVLVAAEKKINKYFSSSSPFFPS